jgi:FkbM family methyltransferase
LSIPIDRSTGVALGSSLCPWVANRKMIDAIDRSRVRDDHEGFWMSTAPGSEAASAAIASAGKATPIPGGAGDSRFSPLRVSAAEVAPWRACAESWQHKLARFWSRHVPRAKGAFPRLIGRHFGSGLHDVARTASGAALAIDFASLDIYCAIERLDGNWDKHVLDACCNWLRPGAVFYDIGANVGFMSMELSKRFGGSLEVYAFEPQPSLARCVAISAALNSFDNVKVFACLLGDTSGITELFLAAHSIHASILAPREAGAAAIRCPMTTLDELLDRGVLPPPHLIKIDVEGSEPAVFRGGARMLAKHRPVIVLEAGVESVGYTRQELCRMLHDIGGYRFCALEFDGRIAPADDRMRDASLSDLIAVPPGL